jgi:hypothetical protein
MNQYRHSRLDDILFVIALLVPVAVAGARYAQVSQEQALIAKAVSAVHVVQARTPGDARRG